MVGRLRYTLLILKSGHSNYLLSGRTYKLPEEQLCNAKLEQSSMKYHYLATNESEPDAFDCYTGIE